MVRQRERLYYRLRAKFAVRRKGMTIAGITGMAAAVAIATLLTQTTYAASTMTPSYRVVGPNHIRVNGVQVSSPLLIQVNSDKSTTYAPLWYLQQAVKKAGYLETYNTQTHQWDITVPDVDASLLAIPGGVGTGNASISINGTIVKKLSPQFLKDVAGGAHAHITTYVPAVDVGLVLEEAGLLNSWNGQDFDVR